MNPTCNPSQNAFHRRRGDPLKAAGHCRQWLLQIFSFFDVIKANHLHCVWNVYLRGCQRRDYTNRQLVVQRDNAVEWLTGGNQPLGGMEP